MTIEDAEEIISLYEKYDDGCCTCHMGHPPCGYCTDKPSEEEYEEALSVLANQDLYRLGEW